MDVLVPETLIRIYMEDHSVDYDMVINFVDQRRLSITTNISSILGREIDEGGRLW
jgi:hypothetical protein